MSRIFVTGGSGRLGEGSLPGLQGRATRSFPWTATPSRRTSFRPATLPKTASITKVFHQGLIKAATRKP
ncbi:UDP-glucose 4-epimerase (EC 5.1.3.2) [Arthrobacter sp. DR-2P]|nr:UDP-glucose 4-epimerase (EC 5.1.3.2) [Arthrobacter sp. DR-2P]